MIKLTSKKGLGLTEVLMATMLFSFIMAGLYSMLHVGNISWQSQSANFDAQAQMRTAIDTINRDLRVGDGLVITQQTSSNVSFTFTKSGEGTITYTWANSGINANRLLRATTAATRIIARDISAIVLTNNITNVIVDLTANVKPLKNSAGTATTSNFRLVEKVAMR